MPLSDRTGSRSEAIPGDRTAVPAVAERGATPLAEYPLALAWGAVGAFFVVPLVALTLDVSKSPVVADVMVGPLAWLVILGMLALLRGRFPSRPTPWAVALGFAAVASIGWGVRTQAAAYSADRFMSQHRRGARAIGRLYDDLAAEARRRGWSDVGVFCNSIDDYLNGQIATVLTYERHGYLLHAGNTSLTVLAIPEQEVFRQIAASQFVILCHRTVPSDSFDYPFNRELDAMRPRVEAVCRRDRTEIGHYQIFGNEVRLFVRRVAPASGR